MIIVTLDTHPPQEILGFLEHGHNSTALLVQRWAVQLKASERTTLKFKEARLNLPSSRAIVVLRGTDLTH